MSLLFTVGVALFFCNPPFGQNRICALSIAQFVRPVVLFALLALLVRPVAFLLSLARVRLSRQERVLLLVFSLIVLDVRTERSYEGSDLQAREALRLVPEGVERQAGALGLPRDAWLIAYCS